jgi:hypothetical protein
MELVTIHNFESADAAEINSPRTLEACLRSGIDPQELYYKSKKAFKVKGMEDKFTDIKYEAHEKKRQGYYPYYYALTD